MIISPIRKPLNVTALQRYGVTACCLFLIVCLFLISNYFEDNLFI